MDDYVEVFKAFGESELRMIATHDATNYEIRYVRDDLGDEYSTEELYDAHRSLVANQVSSDDFSQAVDNGRMLAQQYFFEDVLAFVFPTSRYDGVLVSYERDASIRVADVVEAGVDALE